MRDAASNDKPAASVDRKTNRMTSHLGTLLAAILATAAEPRPLPPADPLPDGAVARLGSTRLRHAGPANCIAFSPNGRLLASGGDDRLIRFWEPATGLEVGRLEGQAARIAFTPDGRGLLAGDDNGILRFWDVDSRDELGADPAH